jgi:hypothetical protein
MVWLKIRVVACTDSLSQISLYVKILTFSQPKALSFRYLFLEARTINDKEEGTMFGGIMKIWQILDTLIEAIVLMETLLGKKITTLDGDVLGTAADIKLDLMRDEIWVMVEYQRQWSRISSKQIASLTNEVMLFENWTPTYLAEEAGTLP